MMCVVNQLSFSRIALKTFRYISYINLQFKISRIFKMESVATQFKPQLLHASQKVECLTNLFSSFTFSPVSSFAPIRIRIISARSRHITLNVYWS